MQSLKIESQPPLKNQKEYNSVIMRPDSTRGLK